MGVSITSNSPMPGIVTLSPLSSAARASAKNALRTAAAVSVSLVIVFIFVNSDSYTNLSAIAVAEVREARGYCGHVA